MSDLNNNNPSDEFNNVVKSFVKDTNNCIKDAESAAAKARRDHEEAIATMIHQNTASGESTPNNTTITPVQTSSTPTIASSTADSTTSKEGEDLLAENNNQPPASLEEAVSQINRLREMKAALLEEQKRNNTFVQRYSEKVAKQERMATLHHLIPRQLFVREDRYNQELEKVYKWSGISDQEIADFYRRKLGNNIRQHGASSTRGDHLYQNFREVPDFSKVNGKPLSSSSTASEVMRNLEFMKKIAGGNN